ncbi:Clp protease N-terminal domain-containing protein [Amycolatopsis sp. MtRt-6]|uniref:Clp protease N-terminal domain-containing protein n=1 Tax=Amycolatopsis sp. MtRt-6 TaxID=2792782 RepID=UPI001A8E2210|nr:Clp protease N-terminal domain-containing protein [Amycolatopsis sp. MtRt-6]
MFERFTDRARRVVVLAQEEAKTLSHNYIGTEHILLGLAHEGEGVAARALEAEGATLEGLRHQIDELIGPGTEPSKVRIPFTSGTKRVLDHSLKEATRLGQSYVGTEHLLLGLLHESDGGAADVLMRLKVPHERLKRRVEAFLGYPVAPAVRQSQERTEDHAAPNRGQSSPLKQLGRNLTELAQQSALDPTVGRTKEIDRLVQVLSRRTRHNPVLVGEHGVGKTAVFDGLAQRIAAGEVPARLKGKEVHALDHGGREGGDLLREALAEVRARDDVILLLDDISDLLHGDHAEILSAAVLHGDVLVGCTATPENYRRANAESPALTQLFQPIQVAEMSTDTALEVLRVMRGRLADHHHLVIEDEVLTKAVELASRYDRRHRLPRSAIDLIDEACARTTGSPNLGEAELSRTMQDLRNEWKIEAELLGMIEPAYRGPAARPTPDAFLQVYGGVDTEIWRIG